MTILAGFVAITQSKIIAATFRTMEKTRLDELYIYVVFSSKMNISNVIFKKLKKKMLKIANFGPKYLGPQIFPRHAVCGSKLEI